MLGTQQLSSQPLRFGGNIYEEGYLPGRFKNYEVGNGPLSRGTAEWTILEISMILRMGVVHMICREGSGVRRTEFHQKRHPACRHKPDGNIGTKYQCGQKDDGQHIGSPTMTRPGSHTRDGNDARGRPIVPVATHRSLTIRGINPSNHKKPELN